MSDRKAELRQLATALCDYDVVEDAWLAKSFTDQLLVVDLKKGAAIPDEVTERLNDHDLYGANEVYETDGEDQSSAGAIANATRHQFVDVQTRGEHQSYVID